MAGINELEEAKDLTPKQRVAKLDEFLSTMRPILADWRILGLPCKCDDSVPEAGDDEVVIYYGDWDLPTLRKSAAGQRHMQHDQNWYDEKGWKAEPGYYRLNLRVPNSKRKNWNAQVAHLRTIDEVLQPAAITVAASALLVHLTETGNDLLKNKCCRCREPLPDDHRAILTVNDGRVHVGSIWGGLPDAYIWLASSRLVAPMPS